MDGIIKQQRNETKHAVFLKQKILRKEKIRMYILITFNPISKRERKRIGRREKWPKKSWEEGEIGGKSREEEEIGSESREKGHLLPCSSPLIQPLATCFQPQEAQKA